MVARENKNKVDGKIRVTLYILNLNHTGMGAAASMQSYNMLIGLQAFAWKLCWSTKSKQTVK